MMQLFTCPCLPTPHASHVITVRGVPTCTWSWHEARPVEADGYPVDDDPDEIDIPLELDRLSL